MTIDAVIMDETIVIDYITKGTGQISVSCTRAATAQVANIWLCRYNDPTRPLAYRLASAATFTQLDTSEEYMIIATDADHATNDAYISIRITPDATPTEVDVDFESLSGGGGGGLITHPGMSGGMRG